MEIAFKCLMTLAALALLVAAPVSLVRGFRFLGRAQRASGRVLDRSLEHSGDGVSTRRLRVAYRVMDGREFTLDQKSEHDRNVGDVVEVLYDPSDPERAYLKFGVPYLVVSSVVMLAFGLGFGYLALVMWLR